MSPCEVGTLHTRSADLALAFAAMIGAPTTTPTPALMLSPDILRQIAELRASQPYDGRHVTLRESRGGWKYEGLSGICTRLSTDRRHMALVIEHDPEGYWPIGMEILAELDHESVALFHERN